jgi:hypothetical protein
MSWSGKFKLGIRTSAQSTRLLSDGDLWRRCPHQTLLQPQASFLVSDNLLSINTKKKSLSQQRQLMEVLKVAQLSQVECEALQAMVDAEIARQASPPPWEEVLE